MDAVRKTTTKKKKINKIEKIENNIKILFQVRCGVYKMKYKYFSLEKNGHMYVLGFDPKRYFVRCKQKGYILLESGNTENSHSNK